MVPVILAKKKGEYEQLNQLWNEFCGTFSKHSPYMPSIREEMYRELKRMCGLLEV